MGQRCTSSWPGSSSHGGGTSGSPTINSDGLAASQATGGEGKGRGGCGDLIGASRRRIGQGIMRN
jgi:hypothetical protein